MAPVLRNSSSRQAVPAESTTADPPYSALTRAGESLFMCSSKEGHTCYHACKGHGRYPLWSDEDFMLDDVDDEEPEVESKKEEEEDEDGSSSEYEFDSDEEWISDTDRESEAQFWREINESVERTRQERDRREEREQRVHYGASDLRFLPVPGRDGSAMEHIREGFGPLVGVIHTKPPPEYVWYLSDDSESWMRGSLPERLSEEPDGAYHRYKYHVWDQIPSEDVHESDSDDDDDDGWGQDWEEEEEEEEEMQDEQSSWSEQADQQEQQQVS